MNKKLLVLAVTSAVAATSAYADTPNVNVYGKLYPQYQTESGHGHTIGTHPTGLPLPLGNDLVSKQGVASSNSNIGFKGDVDVGGGMKGWFQVETNLRLDTGAGTWASRNSAAGISGNFGNVFLGNWDTVYKQLGDPVSFLGISSGNFVSTSGVLSKPALGSASAASFHLRQPNNIEYDSPTIAGFTLMANYSPDESKTLTRNAYIRDIGIKWEQGPLYIALANELHNDMFGMSASVCSASTGATGGAITTINGFVNGTCSTSGTPAATTGAFSATSGAHSEDTANRLSVKYNFPTGTEVGLDVARLEGKESPAAGAAATKLTKFKWNAYSLVATQKIGSALQVAASYVKADKGSCSLLGGGTCLTDGLDSKQMSLGAKYDFNKRTSVFAIASKITNGAGAQRALESTPAPGVDPQMVAAGVIVSF